MSSISDSKGQPQINIFNHSLHCMSDMPKIQKEIAEKHFKEVPQIADKNKRWSRLRIATEIATLAYKEFEQTMKKKYSAPGYDYFLKCSIEAQYPYFYTDLTKRVEKLLEELNLSED